MPILVRYVLVEFLKVFGVTLVAATGLVMLVGVTIEARLQGLGLVQMLRLVPYIVPEAMRFAVPGATLFAACSVYGRMAATNEVVAVKSLGISPIVLLRPVWILACLLSFAELWLNDLAVSWGRIGIRRVVVESVEEIAYGMLSMQKTYSTARFSITVQRVDEGTLIAPTLTLQPSGEKNPITMTAEYGQLRSDPEENTLTIRLHNGSIESGGVKIVFPDTIERVIPLPDATNAKTPSGGPSQLPLGAISEETARQTRRIVRLEEQLAAKAAYQMLTGDFAAVVDTQWQDEQNRLRDERQKLFRLKSEPHRRWSAGFSCLCFALVGAPLAIRLRHADFLTSFFLCFLPILVVYYPLLAYGIDRAKNGALPPIVAWLGNAILVLCGLWLMRKVMRY
jgi:lipopolysaccharide export system permease protein